MGVDARRHGVVALGLTPMDKERPVGQEGKMAHWAITHERLRRSIIACIVCFALFMTLRSLAAEQREPALTEPTSAGTVASTGERGETGKGSEMTVQLIEDILRETATEIEGGNGAWQFFYSGTRMMCITDSNFDRMRIIAPIMEQKDMTEAQMRSVLDANFHTALDARYATNDGVLYSAFIHPLSPLQNDQLRSALEQVANLVSTFGSTYQSTDLTFGQ